MTTDALTPRTRAYYREHIKRLLERLDACAGVICCAECHHVRELARAVIEEGDYAPTKKEK